jgi:hypothetical protein
MGNLFFVSHKKKFMFLSVSKNACSSLKSILYRVEYGHEFVPGRSGNRGVHHFWNYSPYRGRGTKIDRGNKSMLSRYPDYLRFVVYRDPVDRFMSLYHNKVLWPPHPHFYYTEMRLEGLALDPFLDVVEEALQIRNPLYIDEHMRPQARCCTREDVDYIVPIKSLTDFLRDKLDVAYMPQRNQHQGVKIVPTQTQVERIRALYREDYDIVPNYPE